MRGIHLIWAAAASFLQPTLAELLGPVDTTSGRVEAVPGKNAGNVSAFLGIPFAQPPTGPRRWLRPAPYIKKSGEETAVANKKQHVRDCPGSIALPGAAAPLPGDPEDCLYLSVWAPPTGTTPKAVLIWIYGGAFVGGSHAAPVTDGSRLAAQQDVIVVAGNYRLTLFGYPGSKELPDQNAGLLDQRLVVEWARDNIANFGGDPNKMVLVRRSLLAI
jgi:cholinesterase